MQQSLPHFFYLAPILGITDALFRSVFQRHFPFFDAAVAPFINPQRFAGFDDKLLGDVLPENNMELPVIPQLLQNEIEGFLRLGRRLEGLGHTHINWNLGCPSPMIARKQRGSGLLPHGDRIVDMLSAAHEQLGVEISIKTRLGYEHNTDLLAILPRLEHFPLKEIIIHPRIGKQLYRGHADRDGFARCQELTGHRLVYNGDIRTAGDFALLSHRFPTVRRWMIGRGALADPFLLADIKGIAVARQQRLDRLRLFHDELYTQLRQRLQGPGHLLSRMKQLWVYLAASFPEDARAFKKIARTSSESGYLQVIDALFCRKAASAHIIHEG